MDLKALWLPGGELSEPRPEGCSLSATQSAKRPLLPASTARPPRPVKRSEVPGARPETGPLVQLLFREPLLSTPYSCPPPFPLNGLGCRGPRLCTREGLRGECKAAPFVTGSGVLWPPGSRGCVN